MCKWLIFEKRNLISESESIYDYDIIACFDTEREAIDFEMESPDSRVRRLIRIDSKRSQRELKLAGA